MCGIVYRSIDKHVGKTVSVKKVRANSASDHGVPSALIREITLLKLMKHPNIVSYVLFYHSVLSNMFRSYYAINLAENT